MLLSSIQIENVELPSRISGLLSEMNHQDQMEETPYILNDAPIGGGEEMKTIIPEEEPETKEKREELNLPEWSIFYPVICPKYTQRYWSGHKGVDLINENCNNSIWIVAVQSGIIIYQGWNQGYGNQIQIDHGNGFITTYSHLSKFELEEGDKVELGQKIGDMGSTGHSTGTHLHFEILYNDVKIDPDIYLKK